MAKQKSSSLRTDSKRADLRSDSSLLLQSSLPLARSVSTLGNEQIIGMVNTGLNDFSVTKDGVCLSLIMAGKFLAITEALRTVESPTYRVEAGQILKTRQLHKELQEELADVVYIYKKLKADPKGLNWSLLNAYQQQYPDAQLNLLFRQMDHWKPSTEKKKLTFSSKPPKRGSRV